MAYPFLRSETDSQLAFGQWAPRSRPGPSLFRPAARHRHSPVWRRFRAGYEASLIEPLEPRLLLSADFMPAAADAMGDGFDLFEARLTDFFATEADLSQRIPFLLHSDGDDENIEYEAPAVSDLFGLYVDTNQDGVVDQALFTDDDDEAILANWDTSNDGFVDTAELLDALLFTPLQNELAVIAGGGQTAEDFVDALVNDGLGPLQGFDVELTALGGQHTLSFDLISATDLTEEPDAEMAFSLAFSLTITRDQMPIDLGLEADDLLLLAFEGNALAPEPVTLPVAANLSFGFEFGVYTGGQSELELGAEDFFLRHTEDLQFLVAASDNNKDFNLNIGFLGARVVGGEIDLQGQVLTELIDPNTPAVLGFETGQYGVESASGTVTAANPLPAPDLPHDAGFVLRVGQVGFSADVLVVDDGNNGSTSDLLMDVQTALVAAGLEDIVEASLGGSDELMFSLVATDPGALGFDTESLALETPLLATGSPASNEFGDNVSFLLSVGGALPRLVTLRFPGAEREDIGFGANQTTTVVNPLVAQNAANGTGTLDAGGDMEANFELRVTESDGTQTTQAVSVLESALLPDPNASPGDLLADLNDAIAAAGLGSLVTATESAGVFSLEAAAGVTAIEILSADDTTEMGLGFSAGQASFLALTADNPVGNASFNDVLDNTFDGARFTLIVNGSPTTIDVAADDARTTGAELATAIDAALSTAGLAVSALEVGGSIVLVADDASVLELAVETGNQNLDDLLFDLNNALGAAGLGNVTADEDTGNIRLTAAGGESLEISQTLTFDAGLRGLELNGSSGIPDVEFETSGDNASLTFNLPVEVKEGLREAGSNSDYDPQDMAIVGNINPFTSSLVELVPILLNDMDQPILDEDDQQIPVNRFYLDYTVNPLSGDGAAIPNPIPDGTLQLINFAEALQFNEIGPGAFIGMLGELGAALDSLMQNGAFANYGIPFTDATLKDLVVFEDMIKNSLIYDNGADGIFNDSGTEDGSDRLLERRPIPDSSAFETFPSFSTAQEMAVRLSEILSLPLFTGDVVGFENAGGINPTYDPASNELTFDINIMSSRRVSVGVDDPETPAVEGFSANFDFNVDLAPFGEFNLTPVGVGNPISLNTVTEEDQFVTIEARTAFAATYGFDLTPQLDEELDHLEARFFVRDAILQGAFIAELPTNGVAGTAMLGLVGLDIGVDGTLGAQFSAQLQAEGGAPGSQVTLEAIQEDIQDTYAGNQPALEVVTDPLVSKLDRLEYNGSGPQFASVAAGNRIIAGSGGTAYVLDVDAPGNVGSLLLFGVTGNFVNTAEFFHVTEIDDAPPRSGGVVGALSQEAYFGDLTMDVRVQDGFDEPGFAMNLTSALNGLSGVIDLHLTGFGNPNASPDPIAPLIDSSDLLASLDTVGTLSDYIDMSYSDLLNALQGLRDLVAELELAYPVLSQVIPIVNRSFSDLLGLRDGVDRAVASAASVLEEQAEFLDDNGNLVDAPTLTLQGMASALRGAFGLDESTGGLDIDVQTVNGTPYLTLDFDITESVSTTLGLDVDLGDGIPNLTSSKVLRADGNLGWGFRIGINLDNPGDVQLFNPEGGFDGDLTIVGEGATNDSGDGVGSVFLAQVGQMPVQVMDALVDIELDFDLGGLNFGPSGIKSLDAVTFGDFISKIDTQDYTISVPLFDVDGGLTGFLGEITASGNSIIDDAQSLLDNGLLPGAALDELTGLVDDFVAGLDEFAPLDNLLLLTDLADLFFETVQDLLDQATSIGIPIIGDNLADGARFIENFRDQFITKFRQLIANTNDIEVSDVTQFIENFFTGIGLDIVATAQELANDIDDIFDDEVRWNLSLGDTYSVPFDLGFDVGVPLLGMEVDMPLAVELAWAINIGLGVNQADGAFVILNQGGGKELDVDVRVDLPESDLFRGELGFLELIVENRGSGLQFDFDIDLSNTAGGDLLPISDIGNLGFDTMIGGGALDGNDHLLDLELQVGVKDLDVVFPRLVTDFVMDWSLTPQGLVDNAVAAGLELIDFGDVKVDLTSFLGGFLGEMFKEIDRFLGPLAEITDTLDEPIPILSALTELVGAPPVTLLSLASALGENESQAFLDFIEDLEPLFNLFDSIQASDEAVLLSIGNLSFFDDDNPMLGDALFDVDAKIDDVIGDAQTFISNAGSAINSFNDAINALPESSTKAAFTTDLSIGDPGSLFSFPFLDNPASLLGLLIQQPVTLVQVDIPRLGVGFDYEQFFTIFGPLGASVGFGFYVGADFSFGFDTYGLDRFAKSDFTNPGLIFDGFFFGDREAGEDGLVTTGTDIEEIFLEMTLTAAAELNLGIASGGVGGGITARIGWDWYDPNNDGAVHISEILNTLNTSNNPLVIFDLQGALLAELFWYLVIDFGIVEFETGGNIYGPEPVFNFDIPFDRPPILATDLENGTLMLNMGPNAIDRLNGDTSDGNESFEIDYQGGDIRVRAPSMGVNNWQTYSGNFTHIVGLGGQGNDSMIFTDFHESPTPITFNLQGGVGDDVIEFIPGGAAASTGAGAVIRGGSGNDRLVGSHLDDEIYGELGDDEIEGGAGYDVLFGDDGTYWDGVDTDKSIGARVTLLDGNDMISGGDQDDIIIGGGGLDTLSGDAGNDVIIGDGVRFGFDQTGGHLDVSSFNLTPFVPNDPLDDDPAVSTDDKIQAILLDLTSKFTGTDLGAGADDTIDGGDDNDIIFGGAANDTIDGGSGNDHVVGGKGFDIINGEAGDDVLFGNEQDDIMSGGDDSDVMSGGFGDDTMHGDGGNDYMTGSRGRDIMFGDADNDELHGQGEPDIMFGGTEDDLVVGGVGADIMFGDDGIVVKFDGVSPGTDLVVGNGSAALAAPYKAGADDISGSLDLILTDVVAGDGNDILSGGEAGDIILGGGGDDLGGGDVDPRAATANTNDPATSNPDGEDILIGDGGVVEFHQRRLQRIASVFASDPAGSYRDTLFGDNGNDVIIGGRGSDGDNNGDDPTTNVMGNPFLLAGGHGPGRGPTDAEVSDEDIILGDNGELVYVGTIDPGNFGKLAYIQTTDTANSSGGADTAYGQVGDDIILGGVNGSVDVLTGSVGEDVILGDNGLIHLNYNWSADGDNNPLNGPPDGDVSSIDLIRSYNDGLGGVDIISGDAHADVLLGGEAGDFIYGDNASASSGVNDLDDVMLGDNGDIFLAGTEGRRLVQGTAIDLITTTDIAEGSGGADVMSGNSGADVILGGVNDGGIDHLYGDAQTPAPTMDGNDIILGDNGLLDYTFGPDTDRLTLDRIETAAGTPLVGGVDHIFGNAGSDTAFGGTGADRMFGDNDEITDESGVADLYGQLGGEDILVGDQGEIDLVNNLVTRIETTDASNAQGGADHIQGNDFSDIILGGVGGDELHGEAWLPVGYTVADLVTTAGDDTLVGDEGRVRLDVASDADLAVISGSFTASGDGDPLTVDLIETLATGILGGNDQIYGNDNTSLATGDVAMGGSGDDLVHGDFYLGADGLTMAPNPGADQILGDGGQKYLRFEQAVLLRSKSFAEGGSDTLHGNDGDDVVIGGMFDDLIFGETSADLLALATARAGEDILLGDNGRLDWSLPADGIAGRADVQDHLGGSVVSLDDAVTPDLSTLDRIQVIAPTNGGNDVIYGNGNSSAAAGDVLMGGTGNDNLYGDTDEALPDGVDGPDGADLLFGDHGKLYPTLPSLDQFFVNNHFFSIFTSEADGADLSGDGGHNDFEDVIWGNAANDILIGGQDDDILLGGTGDDDLIGGHNVSGGDDELDDMPAVDRLAITPTELADLNPADVNELNDILDGGEDDDVLAGDNAIVIRQDDTDSPRFRMTANGLLYRLESDNVDNLADIDVGFSADVTGTFQPHQDMDLVRTVILLDHSEQIETDAASNWEDPRPFGNDVMAGAAQDDELFGQLGDDIIQGDGLVALGELKQPGDFDIYNPAQDAEPSFDLRSFTQRVDLNPGNDQGFTLRFDVFESLDDGDDYIEGNGGNDRIYGNLGQDDLIGGSSMLFGLGDNDPIHDLADANVLRPDGADMIYGGAGNPALLSRSADFSGANDIGADTLVPEAERHATDADTILGDNGDIFRIVVADTDPVLEGNQLGYAVFNYDRDAVVAYGFQDDGYGAANGEITIRVRAVNLGDYGYGYSDQGGERETLGFLPSARGEGDLIYGESGDDIVHGMTGDDVIFGNSEHDDLYGEIGNDFLLGGTGIDGIVGDDGLILTRRNSDTYDESLYGIAARSAEQTNLKNNEQPDPNSLNAVISSPGNIQRAVINVENELVKGVELFAFRTDDLDGQNRGEFDASIRFNDIIFGGLQNDFIHSGDGDDAVSGAEALPTYYSGEVSGGFDALNTFLQAMQSSPPNTPEGISDVADLLTDNPFWFAFAPYNPGDILRFEGKEILEENGQRARTRDEFAWYDEFNPRRKLMFDFDALAGDIAPLATLSGIANPIDFLLNFDETEGPDGPVYEGDDEVLASDGADRIFGDLGNDWIVGGTGRDHMYGGRGFDLLNMDDNHDSGFTGRVGPHDPEPDPLDNKDADEYQAYADIVYSGAGRDVMILNTGADRAIDWVGEYNSYIVPFSPFGAFHISRTLQPQVPEFLYSLSASDGIDARVDPALLNNTVDAQLFVDQKRDDVRTDDPDPLRAFEPYGELGMVRQTDYDWQDQTGAPNDPQPGNLQGKREIMRRELFNDAAAAVPLAADVGNLNLSSGMLEASPAAQGGEVVGLYPLGTQQPMYTEVLVTINADKDKAGFKSNGYVIFDYRGPEDFKFAGADLATNKLQIGHRDASGWVIDTQVNVQLRANQDFDLTVVLFGTRATAYVDQGINASFDFGEALNNNSMLGLGTDNAIARFDDFQVQTLPPQWTFTYSTNFTGANSNPFTAQRGGWGTDGGQLHGDGGHLPAVAVDSVDVAAFTRLELLGTLNTENQGGFVFDYFSKDEFKFAALDVANDEVIIGYFLDGQWRVEAAAPVDLEPGVDYQLTVTMFGSTASISLDGTAIATHSYNSILNDGQFGVLSLQGSSHFSDFLVRGDDPAYAASALMASGIADDAESARSLTTATIDTAAQQAITQMEGVPGVDMEALAALAIVVDDLPGNQLARFEGERIVLDHNAAGHGWYTGVGAAEEQIDLISTLLHEYGHAVGLEHDSGIAFMANALGTGERFSTAEEPDIQVFDEDSGEYLEPVTMDAEDVLLLDTTAPDAGAPATSAGLIQWHNKAVFSGRQLQIT
ncbi:calcium-binding protein [Parahaliea maris]|uniref:Calcium-binding protein n=1 Tax=Parahaliea maris TaxID=2716870 RepID=A0A5C9A612_9GAMM|nr:LEPR-XLL domain-containing protein [Parahaliea maris]TXS95200.1 calcium-binding protein [Parahaliea maris]